MKTLFLILVLMSSSAFAVKEYYGISRSIRSLGMGGAFYGYSNDEYALFYNPAGLSLYDTDWELMLRINSQMSPKTISAFKTFTNASGSSVGTILNDVTQYQGTPLYAGVGLLPYYVRKNFAIGLLLPDFKSDMALLGRDLDSSIDVTAILDAGLVFGYGRSLFNPNLHLGLNGKFLVRGGGNEQYNLVEFAKNQSLSFDLEKMGGIGAGVDFDLGATYILPSSIPIGISNRVSLVISNLLASPMTIAKRGTKEPPGLSRTVSLGTHTIFEGIGWIDNFHVLIDFAEWQIGGESRQHLGARNGSIWKHVNIGLEMPMRQWFTFRTGLHQGYITAGLGVDIKYFNVDFATYEEELSQGINRLSSRRFALSLAFGAGAPPPPPRTLETELPVFVPPQKPEQPVTQPKETPKAPIAPEIKPEIENKKGN